MTKEILQSKSKDDVLVFIRGRLTFEDESMMIKRSFEMSGYESQTGACTLHNSSILNEFADLGIYDYTSYLFLDFYKGQGTLYWKYFYENENLEFNFGGYGTTEIIYEIFQKTIFSNKRTRRR